MDPYKVLGLTESATVDDIKKAYKKLAMKFHPDRNDGNDAKFKEIGEAYEKIKDGPQKWKGPTFGQAGRSTSDFGFNPDDIVADVMSGRYTKEDFSDILREARYKHHRQVSVTAPISLQDAVTGGSRPMQIRVHGRDELVKVHIPTGLLDGESVKYPKLIHDVDVVIKFTIMPDKVWEIDKLDLIKQQDISIWDLILGGALNVTTIDGSVLRLKIPPKTQPGTQMRVKGKGVLSRLNNKSVGDMLVRLNAKIPDTIPDPLLDMIRGLSD